MNGADVEKNKPGTLLFSFYFPNNLLLYYLKSISEKMYVEQEAHALLEDYNIKRQNI